MKTSELTGAALDWAVAKCEPDDTVRIYFDEDTGEKLCHDDWDIPEFSPSTDWLQGGAIIDRESIAMSSKPDGLWAAYAPKGTRLVQHGGQAVEVFNWTFKQEGYTPLIAAMRCYVASRLGDEVELPKELDHEDR
jgi:hypothetical protein